MCSPKLLVLEFLFTFFFTAAHFHLAMAASISHLSHRCYEIVMFSFQRNSSPLFSITRSSSFSVILVSVDIEKDSTLLLFFLSKSLW